MQYIQILSFWGDIGKEIGNIALKILALPFMLVFLLLDGIVYTLVAYSYKLFELMSRMNFSTITMWLNPVISRIKALVLVLVLFMVGYTLITYLVDPNKASNGAASGVSLLKNIAITAILLAFYSTAFTLLNELTFVLIGAPDGYNYDLLNDWFGVTNNGEPGLVTNLILGPDNDSGDEAEEEMDFGRRLAINTLSIFLHGTHLTQYNRVETSKLAKIYSDAVSPNKDFNLLKLPGVALDIDIIGQDDSGEWAGSSSIEYKYPILSTIVGLYLVYTLTTIAIEIGARAFKLVIMQILAPIAIITIIKDGWKSQKWQKFLKVLGSIYVNLFVRIGGMLFITALITKAWTNVSDLYDDANITTGFTQYLLLILIVVAGYRVASTLPSFIDSVLGTNLASNTGGFGNFLRDLTQGNWGIPGRVATGAAGLARGVRDGIQSGRVNHLSGGATAYNAVRSGIRGAREGSRGNNIAQNLRNVNANTQNARNHARTMAANGGTLRSNIRSGINDIGYGIRERTGRNYVGAARTNEAIAEESRRHQTAVDAETNRYQTRVNDETTRYQGDVTAENTRFAGSQATLNADVEAKINTANAQHQAVTANLTSQIQQHQQALQSAEQAMFNASSQFTNIDSGAGIQYGSSVETFAHTAADNDFEYNQFREAAEHYRMDAQSATNSADRAHAIEQAHAADRAAEARHAEVITLATQEYERAHENAISQERTVIERLEVDIQQADINHQTELANIETYRTTEQTRIDNEHTTNMQTVENEHATRTAPIEQEHATNTQEENTRHQDTDTEHQRLMERYTRRQNNNGGQGNNGGNGGNNS